MSPQAPGALSRLNEDQRREYWAALALRHARGLGARTCRKLLAAFGSAYEALQKKGQWERAGVRGRPSGLDAEAWREPARKEWDAARLLDGEIVLWTDRRYPARLRELPDAPVLFYGRGDLALLQADGVAVVGMRRCSAEGRRAASFLAGGLAGAGLTVISGLARGVDREAHLAALDRPGSSIAVLGTGLDVIYPENNADLHARMGQAGLLLSEFAPGTPPVASNFPVRNRIISGLALGVLVVEAALRSGSLITARLALEQNRSVYAVPGAVGAPASAGCQELIRQGAQAVFDASDILSDLKELLRPSLRAPTPQNSGGTRGSETDIPSPLPSPAPRREPDPPPDRPGRTYEPGSPEARILEALAASCGMDMDALCRALDLPVSVISVALLGLELEHGVRRLGGSTYALP